MPNWKGREDIPTCSFDDGCVTLLKLNHVALIQAFKQPLCEHWTLWIHRTKHEWNSQLWEKLEGSKWCIRVEGLLFICCSSAGQGLEEEAGGRSRQRHNRHHRDGGAGSLEKRLEELETVNTLSCVHLLSRKHELIEVLYKVMLHELDLLSKSKVNTTWKT